MRFLWLNLRKNRLDLTQKLMFVCKHIGNKVRLNSAEQFGDIYSGITLNSLKVAVMRQ